jgi:hypothetical protein
MDGICVMDAVKINFKIGPSMVDAGLYPIKVGLRLVEVVLMHYEIGLMQRLCKFLDTIGLRKCPVNFQTKIGHGCLDGQASCI